jgi:hypothetical protein
MKLEFYNKETGEAINWQNHYVVDSFGNVFYDGKDGFKFEPELSFRIIEENVCTQNVKS